MKNFKETFIYLKVKGVISKAKNAYRNLQQMKVTDLDYANEPKIFDVFREWLLEIAQYGLIITIIINTFVGWQGWHNIPLIISVGLRDG